MSNQAVAYLYANGNAMFFDAAMKQIDDLQREGLCGLHEFMRRYPDAIVFWADWHSRTRFVVPKQAVIELLKCLRKTREEVSNNDACEKSPINPWNERQDGENLQ